MMPFSIWKALETLAEELKANHIRLGQRCSGKWLESVSIEETPVGVGLFAAHYTPFLVFGRPPSRKYPPYVAIRKWLDCKGLGKGLSEKEKESLTWAIMTSIRNEGTTWWKRYRRNEPTLTDLTFSEKNIDKAFEPVWKEFSEDTIALFRHL